MTVQTIHDLEEVVRSEGFPAEISVTTTTTTWCVITERQIVENNHAS
jgi:hypothetical protein